MYFKFFQAVYQWSFLQPNYFWVEILSIHFSFDVLTNLSYWNICEMWEIVLLGLLPLKTVIKLLLIWKAFLKQALGGAMV